MFTISYMQQKNQPNQVLVREYNPYNSSDIFEDTIVFDTEVLANGYCLLISTIEAAIASKYSGRCAVLLTEGIVDVTTETLIPAKNRAVIQQRIQMVIDHVPIAKYIQFYSLEQDRS